MQCRLGQLLNIKYQYTSCIDWLFIYLQVVSMSAVYMARTSFQTVSFNLIGWFWYWPMGGMLILSQKKTRICIIRSNKRTHRYHWSNTFWWSLEAANSCILRGKSVTLSIQEKLIYVKSKWRVMYYHFWGLYFTTEILGSISILRGLQFREDNTQ
jgi:hypothetical protein